MSAKGDEIFQSILRKNASSDKQALHLTCKRGHLKKSKGSLSCCSSVCSCIYYTDCCGTIRVSVADFRTR